MYYRALPLLFLVIFVCVACASSRSRSTSAKRYNLVVRIGETSLGDVERAIGPAHGSKYNGSMWGYTHVWSSYPPNYPYIVKIINSDGSVKEKEVII
jgi:hypothetical protein